MKNVSQVLARIYAQALFDIASASGELGRVVDDLGAVREAVLRDRKLQAFFSSPRVSPDEKKRVLSEALEDRIHRATMGLLHVLIDKQRGALLDNIIAEFDKFRDIRAGRMHAHVSAVQPLAEDQREELRQRLESITGKTIVLHEKTDPALLGGMIVKLGDRVIDGSLKRRLARLRRDLIAERS